jgi:hypothetical protein
MKLINTYLFLVLLGCIICSPAAFSQSPDTIGETSKPFSLQFATPKAIEYSSYTLIDGAKGSIAYGNNVWNNKLYSLQYEDALSTSIIGNLNNQTTSGDFHPDDDQHIFTIDIISNMLRKVDISDASSETILAVPVPIEGGIWSVLSIHRNSGEFYGVATNGMESNVYQIDTTNGSTSAVFSTGLSAVISGTFDNLGNLWLFEIENDNIYKLNVSTLDFDLIGSAGFDGDSPQGMAYDVADNQIFLAAYEKNEGPQLRLLNRETGNAAFLSDLPGETTAFAFPGSVPLTVQTLSLPAGWSGISSHVVPANLQLSDLLAPITGQFVLLQNNQGNTYSPQHSIATLQNWDPAQGYSIFMNQATSLTLSGIDAHTMDIPIDVGWNMIPVMTSSPYPVEQLFENFEGLVIVKDIAGTGVYWPELNINTIGNLIPGKAYHLYSSEEGKMNY